MRISVVICTYNPSEKNIARALDAVLCQDLNREEWELLVVDNNSTTPVKDMAVVKNRKVRVVFEAKQGLSAARECGIRHSSGDILVFVDDDNVLASDYLTNVKTIFENSYIGIVSGAIAPEYEEEPPAWLYKFEIMLAIRKPHGEKTYLTNIPVCNQYFPIGAGAAVRRKLIEAYYEAIAEGSTYISGRVGKELSSAEDIDLDFFAISRGFLVGMAGALKMKHIIPASRMTSEYLCRLAVGTTKSAAEVNRKWKSEFGHDVYDALSMSKIKITLNLLICVCLYWMPKFRIRYHFYKTQLAN